MRLPKYFGKPKKPRNVLIVRRVAGSSMAPTLESGRVVVASALRMTPHVGQVVIIEHGGLQKIKRIHQLSAKQVFVVGDNPARSTDSRDFGWLPAASVVARVIWPRRLTR